MVLKFSSFTNLFFMKSSLKRMFNVIMMKKYFLEEVPGIIADFEERPEQVAMANAVAKTLSKGENLLIEAGTGIGKTLAYLIPSAEHALRTHTRIIVSTYSKALQSQLYKKDLPLVKKIFPELKYEIVYGAANYVCRRRSMDFKNKASLFAESGHMDEIYDFLTDGAGVRENSPFHIPDDVWSQINCVRETCGEESCMHFRRCYYWGTRRCLSKCNLIVVNHHLFTSDMMLSNKLLPESSAVIFDEAHRLEEIMREMTSRIFSTFGYYKALREAEEFLHGRGAKKKKGRLSQYAAARKEFEDFIEIIMNDPVIGLDKKTSSLIEAPVKVHINIRQTIADILSLLQETAAELEDSNKRKVADYIAADLSQHADIMDAWLAGKNKDNFYWIEKKPDKNINFCITPYRLGDVFEENVLQRYDSVIMTSATLAAGEDFGYITRQFGFFNAQSGVLKSPFDYANHSLLYLEKKLPSPQDAAYADRLCERLTEIIEITGGATLVLFTSNELMKKAYNQVKKGFPEINFLMQGQTNPMDLIHRFKKSPAVLFATSTFWQGIDVKGDALKCVVITRLPFEVPEHPLQKAIYKHVKEEGGNDFAEIALPRAIFMLKQGFGRLIRSKDDYGAVMILDNRITTKTYGKNFVKSLPEAEITDNLERVISFFTSRKS
jgi:ATP-dependent DNA helicase DinG